MLGIVARARILLFINLCGPSQPAIRGHGGRYRAPPVTRQGFVRHHYGQVLYPTVGSEFRLVRVAPAVADARTARRHSPPGISGGLFFWVRKRQRPRLGGLCLLL